MKLSILKKFYNDESGATAIEYALLAGVIGVGIIAAADNLVPKIDALFERIEEALDSAATKV